MVSKNKTKFDWRKFRKESEEEYVDDPDEEPASQAIIDALGFNPDELNKTKKKQ